MGPKTHGADFEEQIDRLFELDPGRPEEEQEEHEEKSDDRDKNTG